MSNFTEIWKPIKGYEGLYEVSNLGRVKSLPKKWAGNNGFRKTERILNNFLDTTGYYSVALCKKGKGKIFRVHRLVAEAFIENPENKPQVNHKDGVKTNNFWKNLEWATAKENIQHAHNIGIKNNNHLKKIVYQIKDNKVVKKWDSIISASKNLKIDKKSISFCCRNKRGRKTAGSFRWSFTCVVLQE